jgi:hypothetical protein
MFCVYGWLNGLYCMNRFVWKEKFSFFEHVILTATCSFDFLFPDLGEISISGSHGAMAIIILHFF